LGGERQGRRDLARGLDGAVAAPVRAAAARAIVPQPGPARAKGFPAAGLPRRGYIGVR